MEAAKNGFSSLDETLITVAMDFEINKIRMDDSLLICAEEPKKAVLLDFRPGNETDVPIDAGPSASRVRECGAFFSGLVFRGPSLKKNARCPKFSVLLG